MKTSTRAIRFILLIGIFLISAPALLAQDAELVRHFDYDSASAA